MIGDRWPHPRLVVTTSWTNLGVTLVHCFLYGRGYDQDYQLPPYSKVVRILDGHRNMRIFFFLAVEVLGVFLPVLIAPWWHGTHRGHVSYSNWLKGLVSGETFSDFMHFSRQTFLTLAFLFSFLHFLSAFGFFDLIVTSVHFALCLISFLPYFQVRPLFTPFSFLSFTVFLSFVLLFPF